MARPADYLAGIGYASIFGLSFVATKGALEVLAPFELLFLRFALATLLLAALAGFRLIRLDYRGKSWAGLALVCVFQPLLYFTCETFGVKESSASTAGIVIGALPALGTILSALILGERVGILQSLFLGLSIGGVAVIAVFGGAAGGEAGSLLGFILLLGAVASAAFYNVFSRKSSVKFSPVETTFAMMASGAVAFGILALVTVRDGSLRDLPERAMGVIPGILYLGALSSVLAFFLINFTLSRLRVSQSIVFSNLTTVIAVTAGVALRGESFGVAQLAGSLMIVAGVWGTNSFAPGTARAA
jgi:drug/metabolite transporter (DMT)-like permease